jgi:hypothetical protein
MKAPIEISRDEAFSSSWPRKDQRANGGVQVDQHARAELTAKARNLTSYQDFDKSVALDFIIKNLFAKGHTSHLFGPPGSGKSALLGSAAVCLGSQPSWYGFKIKQQLATVFFPFERSELIKKRIWAQCQRDGIDNVPIVVADPLDNLMNDACVDQIVGTILAAEDKLGLEVGLAGFDTVNKGIARGGDDEDKAKDQNRAWGNLRRVHEGMARFHGVHLAGIGHTGKDESRGARGSNAGKGDNDVELQVRDDGSIKSVEISKANELPEGPLMRFRMEPYDTGHKDEDGDPIEVWIPAAEIIATAATKSEPRPTKNQQTMFEMLCAAGAAGLSSEEWNALARAEGIGTKRRVDLYDIRTALKNKHKMIHEYGGRWYVSQAG